MSDPKKRAKIEFGDFQTPIWLSSRICSLLKQGGVKPASILEPTCGKGSFLISALDSFESAKTVVGADINHDYIKYVAQKLARRKDANKAQIFQGDFFVINWQKIISQLPDPLLIIGNPPWVTNSELSGIGSSNLPQKNNFQNHSGIDAITGASNFDIAEWMLLQLVTWITGRQAVMAMLCKTAVARKVLLQVWKANIGLATASIYLIDAQKVFNASVEACLFVYDTTKPILSKVCDVYSELSPNLHLTQIGYCDDQLIANIEFYQRWKHLQNKGGEYYQWRSGIKHDCSKVMELKKTNEGYINELGETYDLEGNYVYPMLKGSEIANSASPTPSRWMLVTQHHVSDSTLQIKLNAPKTWAYLNHHSELLDSRKSIIYKNRPRFSIFGVGEYSFALWKVAIAGMYKELRFVVVGPFDKKPTVLDDTCYFIACQSKEEAEFMAGLLNSETAQQFFYSFMFGDAKRPITAKTLRKLDLFALARELNQEELMVKFTRSSYSADLKPKQLRLLEKQSEV